MRGRPVEITFKLSKSEKTKLNTIINDKSIQVKIYRRAKALLELSTGERPIEVSRSVGLDRTSVTNIRNRYLESGLDIALYGNPRSGRPKEISHKQEQEIVALVCSKPPSGYARWSTALITRECKKKRIIEKISDEAVRKLLHRHELKPWREKNVVRD